MLKIILQIMLIIITINLVLIGAILVSQKMHNYKLGKDATTTTIRKEEDK